MPHKKHYSLVRDPCSTWNIVVFLMLIFGDCLTIFSPFIIQLVVGNTRINPNTEWILFGLFAWPRIFLYFGCTLAIQPFIFPWRYLRIDQMAVGVCTSSLSYVLMLLQDKSLATGWLIFACITYPLLLFIFVGNWRVFCKHYPIGYKLFLLPLYVRAFHVIMFVLNEAINHYRERHSSATYIATSLMMVSEMFKYGVDTRNIKKGERKKEPPKTKQLPPTINAKGAQSDRTMEMKFDDMISKKFKKFHLASASASPGDMESSITQEASPLIQSGSGNSTGNYGFYSDSPSTSENASIRTPEDKT